MTGKSSIKHIKIKALRGSIKDYERLKTLLNSTWQYGNLLYYAYIMADRYDYQSAKKRCCGYH